MSERFITRRTLRHLLMLSPEQFEKLQLDRHMERFTSNGKGYAICYRLRDIEQHLKMTIPFSEF